jgi:hypothetical protein
MLSEFTLNNYSLLSKKKLIINDFIIEKMRIERRKIKNMEDIKYKITEISIPNNKIKDLVLSMWVYKKGVLENLDDLEIEVKIEWSNNNTIYLKCTKNKLENIKKRLNIFLKMINYLKNNSNKITIYLILTKLKKECFETENISAKHINSGYTDFNKNIIFMLDFL